MAWAVDGQAITDITVGGTPTQAQSDWADLCAAAVNAAITTLLNGATIDSPSSAEDELTRSAVLDGVEAYRARDTRMGILTVGPDGEPVRVSTDILWSRPVLARYAIPGIG